MAIDSVPFLVGAVSRGAADALAGLLAGYTVLAAVYAVRGHRHRLEDRWSAAVCVLVMAALTLLVWRDGARLLPAPFSVVVLAIGLGGIAFTLTYTLGRYHGKVERFQAQFGARLAQLLSDVLPEERYEAWRRLRDAWRPTAEEQRKTPHLLMGLVILFYAALGHLLLRGAWDLLYGGNGQSSGSDEGIRNLYAVSHGPWLAGGQVVCLVLSFGLLLLLLPNELLRLKFPELSYPFKAVILGRLRKREAGLFGAHVYIAATTALVALWLPRDLGRWDLTIPALCSTIAVSVFADAASALVGLRWGQRKWRHNPNKSYLGSAGGTTVAMLVSLPLVGLPMAVVTAAAFLVVDIMSPVPVSVSDNLLNPLVLAVSYDALLGHLAPWVPYY